MSKDEKYDPVKEATRIVNLAAQPKAIGIKFANPESGQEFIVPVHDKYPQMGDVHVEGRRVIEVSVEMFEVLIASQGFYPVISEPEGETE